MCSSFSCILDESIVEPSLTCPVAELVTFLVGGKITPHDAPKLAAFREVA